MSFRDRRRNTENQQTDEIVEIIKEAIPNIKKIVVVEPKKKVKEIPEWKKILQEKQAEKKIAKESKENTQPEPVKEVAKPTEKNKSDDTKLALIGTTDTATTFRSIVKKKRLTITEVLENLLTTYIEANAIHK